MRRDFNQILLNLDGTPARDQQDKPIMLGFIATTALLAHNQNDMATAEQKAKRFQIAVKINNRPGAVDITAEELSNIKECIGKFYGPLVVGRSFELLELEPKLVESQPPGG